MARTVLPIVGAVVGAYFGAPQVGYAIGAVIGNAVDPIKVQGPKIGETGAQTTAEGVPRPIIYGTISCTGNVIVAGPLVITEEETQEGKGGGPVTTSDRAFRTFSIRICEGPVSGVLRIWEDEKLVYDVRPASTIVADSVKWAQGTTIYLGEEDQLPDPSLETIYSDMPAYRGTVYIVFTSRDLTDRRGSIPQYRFEVAKEVDTSIGELTNSVVFSPARPGPGIYRDIDGMLGTAIQAGNLQVGGTDSYQVHKFASDLSYSTTSVMIGGVESWDNDVVTPSYLGLQGAGPDGLSLFAGDPLGGPYLSRAGIQLAAFKPDSSYSTYWWNDGTAPPYDGRRTWFSSSNLYLGTTTRNGDLVNNICLFPLGGGYPAYATVIVSNVCSTPGAEFYMHLGNDEKLRVINDDLDLTTYSGTTLAVESQVAIPFSMTLFHGFGVDGDVGVFVFAEGGSPRVEFRRMSDFSLITSYSSSVFLESDGTRVVFTSDSIFIQLTKRSDGVSAAYQRILRFTYGRLEGKGAILADIVSDIHDRCKISTSKFDVSELTDEVAGLLLAGDYTGADAVNTLRAAYFFDSFNADKKMWFPKRGADASFVIDVDDLVEDPDTSKREQAVEYPKKIHLQYQHANSGYAIVKATSARSSADAKVVGESTISVPIVLNEDQAAQTVQKIHKISWAEADGEIELSLPDSFIQYTPTDVGSVTLRGNTTRRRITEWDYADGVIKVKMKKDRQSAYTSDVQGVPVPDPTPPPSTIVGQTILAVMDIPSRIDTEDDLNIYYGVTGAMPAWHGAAVQRSVDAGANFTTVATITQASIMGYTSNDVADASEYFTDRTNTITVTLYRDGQSLDSYTDTQFLSEYGAFALEKADGSWEIMQYRDVHQTSNGDFVLSTLHRGLLNSGTSSHASGARFVMLQRPTHVAMSSALLGQSLTHRAPSLDQSPEEAPEQTDTYIGRSQIEWPVAYLELTRSGSDISATWTPRHRFGTDDNPVASINFQGYRVTIDGGSNGSVQFDTTTAGFTDYDASALGGGVTVTVSALNRITGAGPATSESI